MKNLRILLFLSLVSLISCSLKSADIYDIADRLTDFIVNIAKNNPSLNNLKGLNFPEDYQFFMFEPETPETIRTEYAKVQKEINDLIENDALARSYVNAIQKNQTMPTTVALNLNNNGLKDKVKRLRFLIDRQTTLQAITKALGNCSDKIQMGLALDFYKSTDKKTAKRFKKLENEHCENCKIDQLKHGKPMQQCSICKIAKYCSVDCQKTDWKAHKLVCKQKENENSAAAAGAGAGTERTDNSEIDETRMDFSNIEVD